MTRKEIDEKLVCPEEATHDIIFEAEYGDPKNSKLCENQQKQIHAEIMAEFDRLADEIENLNDEVDRLWRMTG